MTDNLNKFSGSGARLVYYDLWHATNSNYVCGTNTALGNGEDSGMARLTGIFELGGTTPNASATPRLGDDGVVCTFMTSSSEAPSGNTIFGVYDQNFIANVMDKVVKAEGPHDMLGSSTSCNTFTPFHLVINTPAFAQDSGYEGESGYEVTEYLYGYAQDTSVNSQSHNTPHDYTQFLTFTDRGVMPYGEAFTNVAWGRTRMWKIGPYWSTHPVYYHTYIGDGGAAQTFTLGQIPYVAAVEGLQVWDDGVKMTYTTNYSVNITTGLVTFVGTDPSAAGVVVCKGLFEPTC